MLQINVDFYEKLFAVKCACSPGNLAFSLIEIMLTNDMLNDIGIMVCNENTER